MMRHWIIRMLGITESMGQHDVHAPATGARPATALSPDGLLIDVRSSGGFGAGHIAGAVGLPLDCPQTDTPCPSRKPMPSGAPNR